MDTVSGSPSRLRRYVDALSAPDARLRDAVPDLRATLGRYRDRNPDFGRDHTYLADGLLALTHEATALDAAVGTFAAALARLDATAPGTAVRAAPRARFERVHAGIVDAWASVETLLDLVVDLSDEDWAALVWGGPWCLPGRGTYTGSGGVRGPDGRIYPLVIPELEVDGEVAHLSYEADPARDPGTRGGTDEGWRVIDERTGVARVLDYEPTWFDRAVVTTAMMTGLEGPGHRSASADDLQTVGFGPNGRPVVGDRARLRHRDPRPLEGSEGPEPVAAPALDDALRSSRRGPLPPPDNRVRGARAAGGVDMVTGALEGLVVASQLDRPGHNVFRVLFEEHEDGGRRRARLHTYQLVATPNGSGFESFMGYAVDGQLRRKRVRPAPQTPNTMTHGPDARPASWSGSGTVGHAAAGKQPDR